MSELSSAAAHVEAHPIRLATGGTLDRNRLTVFFRLILAIPQFVMVFLWGIAAAFALIVAWFVAVFTGRVPDGMHDFLARFLRYTTRVTGYITLLADPYPPFGSGGEYDVDAHIDGPTVQGRWTVGFRIFMAIPALILAYVFRLGLQVVAFLGWFYALATGRQAQGLQDLGTYCLRYEMQTYAYLLLLTARYPSLSGVA